MEAFGLKYHNAAANIETQQAKLKQDIYRNEQSYHSIKGSLDSIIMAAASAPVRNDDNVSEASSASTSSTVIENAPVNNNSNESEVPVDPAKDDYIMKRFLSAVAKGQVHEKALQEVFDLNNKLETTKRTTDDLLVKFNSLSNDLKEIKREINKIKQYIKIENLLFHNFYLPPGYKNWSSLQFSYFMAQQINYLIPQLDYPLTWEHISTAHPLKTKRKGSNVIVVRFCNRNMRNEIYEKRHFITKRGCAITEHLTEENLNVLKKAKSLFGFNNVCSVNCNVVVAVKGDHKYVKSIEEVNELFETIHAVDQNDNVKIKSSQHVHCISNNNVHIPDNNFRNSRNVNSIPPTFYGRQRGNGKSHRGGYAKRGHYSVRNRQYH